MRRMQRGDTLRGRRFAALCAAILAAESAPYLYHLLRTPPHAIWAGNDFRNLGDLLPYLAWIRQAQEGHLLFVNLYDPTPQPRVLFLPLFLLIGLAARALSVPAIAALHATRIAAAAGLLAVLRRFCIREMGQEDAAVRAFLMLALGSGLPGLISEASPVSSMFDSALHTVAWLLFVLGGGSWLRACRGEGARHALATGGSGALLAFVHPYDALSLALVVLATAAVAAHRRKVAPVLLPLAFAAIPMIAAALVSAATLAKNPALSAWARFPQPRWGVELLSFGTVLVLAIVAVAARKRPGEAPTDPLLAAWAAAQILLLYAPLPAPRRFMVGIQAPLALLAARGFDLLYGRGWRRVPAYLLAAAFPAGIVMLLVDVSGIVPVTRHLPAALVRDVSDLATLPAGVVLAPPGIADLVPSFAGRQVYFGHIDQTPDFAMREAVWEDVVAGRTSSQKLAMHGISYVLLPARGAPPTPPGLELMRAMRVTRLYRVPSAPDGT